MYQGKLDIVKREMTRTGIDLLGVSELRWVGRGHFKSADHTVIYLGHKTIKTNSSHKREGDGEGSRWLQPN